MKTALITGAAQRIGKAIAEHFLAEGYLVILHANTSIDSLREWISTHPHADRVVACIQADLSTEQGQNELIARTISSITTLDLLIHNASTFGPESFTSIDRASYQRMMAVNLDAPFFITQGLLPLLKQAPNPSVINIVDAMWKRPSRKYSHYAASKAGLAILTRTLAIELAPSIRVNGVSPGAILFQPFHGDKQREKILERIPFKRLGEPRDIAVAIHFLHEQATYATGEILVIDGGRSIVP